MFRPASILPIFLAIAAFILSLLVLLAGYKESFLPSVYVLKVDTTNLGVNATDLNVDSVLDRFGIDDDSSISRFLDRTNLTDKIDSRTVALEDKLDDLIGTAAQKLGVADVYVAHMMTYCEGYAQGDEDSNKTKIAWCTDPKLPYSFDPLDELSNRLRDDVTLEQLGIQTDNIEDVINALQVAYKAMSITLVIGVALAGLSILLGLAGLTASRIIELLNGLVAWLSFLMLGVAAAIATAIAVKGRDVFNEYARDAGVKASESKPLMGMIWAAVAAMLITALWWSFTCCCGRHHRRGGRRDEPLVEKTQPVGAPRRRRFGGFGSMMGRRRRAAV